MTNKEDVSNFTDVNSDELRHYNRGQVMANIFEQYSLGSSIPVNRFKEYLREILEYLVRVPSQEQEAAKASHRNEMARRGYSYG